jgi:type II restriction enzyme
VYGSKAQHIFDTLKAQDLLSSEGRMLFDFDGLQVTIQEKSAIGYIFQEWLASWLEQQQIDFREPANSQEFPDFFLSQSNTSDLLEVKTFDADAGANFDVANFDAYQRSLQTYAYRLDADYLIFAYHLNAGIFTLQNMWLKKIWEITTSSAKYALKCQVKQGTIVNIRPAIWYSQSGRASQPFGSRKAFVEAIHATLQAYLPRQRIARGWFENVSENYYQHTGREL